MARADKLTDTQIKRARPGIRPVEGGAEPVPPAHLQLAWQSTLLLVVQEAQHFCR